MAVQLGSGEYTFEVNENWAKVPEEITLGDCAAVGVDRQNRVYAFNRGEHPVAVFDAEGNLLRTWGEGMFRRPHGVHMGPDDTIFLTDDGDHTVRQCTLDGKVLMTLGIPGEPKLFMSGEPFHRCTHTALSPQGDLYVSDGYGNARVHKFAPDGRLLLSWGEPGTDPGQFNIPHNICCDADGWVYVADRENHRIQAGAALVALALSLVTLRHYPPRAALGRPDSLRCGARHSRPRDGPGAAARSGGTHRGLHGRPSVF